MIAIAFDIDGVVADSFSVFRSHIWRDFGYWIGIPGSYRIEVPGVPYSFLQDYYRAMLTHHQDAVRPYPEANEVLSAIVEWTGQPVHFVTARHPDTLEATEDWIRKNLPDIRAYRLIFRPSAGKTEWLIQNRVQFFVEDRLWTAKAVAETGRVKVFLVSRAWNLGRLAHEAVVRIENLKQIKIPLTEEDNRKFEAVWGN